MHLLYMHDDDDWVEMINLQVRLVNHLIWFINLQSTLASPSELNFSYI